jgi:outer membrane receptor protein involved in Fe transport
VGLRIAATPGVRLRRGRPAFAGGCVLLGAALAAAQEPAEPGSTSPEVREEIVVTAERGPEPHAVTPAAVSVLTRAEIERTAADNLAELLERLPGLQTLFAERFSGTPPMIGARGFFGGGEAEYVQLRIDGVPVGDVESGLAQWRAIRASDIERVELLRGPASSLYGDTALAGVVEVFTRPGALTGGQGGASLAAGTFGSADASGRLGTKAGPWLLDLSAGAYRTDGFREHSAAEEYSAGFSAQRPGATGTWTFDVSGYATEREEPGALPRGEGFGARGSDPLHRFDREDSERGRAAIRFRHDGVFSSRASLTASARRSDFVRTLLLAPSLPDRSRREVSSESLSGSFEGETELRLFGREGRLLAGVELGRDWLDTSYRPVGEDGEPGARVASARGARDRFAAFLLQEVPLSARVRLTAGARWDLLRDDFDPAPEEHEAFSPRVGLSVRLGSLDRRPVSLFFVASRAFKAPTLDQLYDPHPFPDFQGGTFLLSNPALRPQRAWNLELGAFYEGASSRMDLSVYWMEVEDEIDFDPATFRYSNIGSSLHRGLEASFRQRIGRSMAAWLSYAWTRAEPREGENRGNQLKNIPEHLLRAGLEAPLPAGITASLLGSLAAGRYLDDGNQFAMKDAATLDLRLERGFRRWRARMDFLNLTDSQYPQVGFVLPDFSGGVALYEYPAAGFALRAGVDVEF